MEMMSGGRYHQYRQSHNDFDSSNESSSYENTICSFHYTKPMNDGDDETTFATTTTFKTHLESTNASINLIAICKYFEDMEEEEESRERQASLQKKFLNLSMCPNTQPTNHANPFNATQVCQSTQRCHNNLELL